MRAFLQDDFLDKKLLDKIKKEIKETQLKKTIEEIDYLNAIKANLSKDIDLEINKEILAFKNYEGECAFK